MNWFWRRREAPPPPQLTFEQYRIIVEPLIRELTDCRFPWHARTRQQAIDVVLQQLWTDREEPNLKKRLSDLVWFYFGNPACYPPLVVGGGPIEDPILGPRLRH